MGTLIAPILFVAILVVAIFGTGLIRYVLGYRGWFEVIVTFAIFVAFIGQGAAMAMLIAIAGGLVFAIICSILYRVMSHKRLARTTDIRGNTRWKWLDCPPPDRL